MGWWWCCTGLPPVLSLAFPATPDTTRNQAAFPGSGPSLWPDWPHLLPPPGELGTTGGGKGAWERPKQAWERGSATARVAESDREGRGHLSVLRPLLR